VVFVILPLARVAFHQFSSTHYSRFVILLKISSHFLRLRTILKCSVDAEVQKELFLYVNLELALCYGKNHSLDFVAKLKPYIFFFFFSFFSIINNSTPAIPTAIPNTGIQW